MRDGCAGDTEIEHLDFALLGDLDVAWFDVAMDDLVAVRFR